MASRAILLLLFAVSIVAQAKTCADGTLLELCGPYATGCTGSTCECDPPYPFPQRYTTQFPGSLLSACIDFPFFIHSNGIDYYGEMQTNTYPDFDVFFDSGPYAKDDLIVWAIQNATDSVISPNDIQMYFNDPTLACGVNASHLDVVLYRGNAELVFGAPGIPTRDDFADDPFFVHSPWFVGPDTILTEGAFLGFNWTGSEYPVDFWIPFIRCSCTHAGEDFYTVWNDRAIQVNQTCDTWDPDAVASTLVNGMEDDKVVCGVSCITMSGYVPNVMLPYLGSIAGINLGARITAVDCTLFDLVTDYSRYTADANCNWVLTLDINYDTVTDILQTETWCDEVNGSPLPQRSSCMNSSQTCGPGAMNRNSICPHSPDLTKLPSGRNIFDMECSSRCHCSFSNPVTTAQPCDSVRQSCTRRELVDNCPEWCGYVGKACTACSIIAPVVSTGISPFFVEGSCISELGTHWDNYTCTPPVPLTNCLFDDNNNTCVGADDELTRLVTCGPGSVTCRNPCANNVCSKTSYQCGCGPESNLTTYYPDYETTGGESASATPLEFGAINGCGIWPQVVKKICRYEDNCEPYEISTVTYIGADPVQTVPTFVAMKDNAATNAGGVWNDTDIKVSCGRRAYSATIVDYRTSASLGRTYENWDDFLSVTGIGPAPPFTNPAGARSFPDTGVSHLTFLRCTCQKGGKGNEFYSVWNDIPEQNGYNCDTWWQEMIDPFEVYPNHPQACPAYPDFDTGKQCNGLSNCHKYTFKGYDIEYREHHVDVCTATPGGKQCSGTGFLPGDPLGSGDPDEQAWLAAFASNLWNVQKTVCSMSGNTELSSWANVTCTVGPWVYRSTAFFVNTDPGPLCDKAKLNTDGLGDCRFMFPLDIVDGPDLCPSLGDMWLPRVKDECIPQLEDGTCRCGYAYQKSRIGWCDCSGWEQDVPFRSEMGPLPENSIDVRYPTAPYERCLMILPSQVSELPVELTYEQVEDAIFFASAQARTIFMCSVDWRWSERIIWDTDAFGVCEPITNFTVQMSAPPGNFPDYFGGEFVDKLSAFNAGAGGLGFGDLNTGTVIPVNCTNALRTYWRNQMLTDAIVSPPLPNETFADAWLGPAYNVFLGCGDCPSPWSGETCETLTTLQAYQMFTSGDCIPTPDPVVFTCVYVDPCPDDCEFDFDLVTCVCDPAWEPSFITDEWVRISTCWPGSVIPTPELDSVDPCSPGGSCASGVCQCDLSSGGSLCDVSSCPGTSEEHTGGCNGRGVCDDGVCDCGRWFFGDSCEFSACSGGCDGICTVTDNIYPACECTAGLFGKNCENALFPPVLKECINDGSPNTLNGRCECNDDFGGQRCSFDLSDEDFCGTPSLGICSGNGICNQDVLSSVPPETVVSFSCFCTDPLFTGTKCELSICPIGTNGLPCNTGVGSINRVCLPDMTCQCEPVGGWVIDIEVAAEPFPDPEALLLSAPGHVMLGDSCSVDVFIGCADYPVITGTGAGRQWTVESLCGGVESGYCDPSLPGDDKCVCEPGLISVAFGNTSRCTSNDCEDPCFAGTCTPGVGVCVCDSPIWTGIACNVSTCIDPLVPENREGEWVCGCADPLRDPTTDCVGFLCPERDDSDCGDIYFGANKFPFPYSEAATEVIFGAPRGVKCNDTVGDCVCLLNVYSISLDDGTCVPLWNLDNTVTITAANPFDIESELTTVCVEGWDPATYCNERRCLNSGVWNMEGNPACPPTGPTCCCTADFTGQRCQTSLVPVVCEGNATSVGNVCVCPTVLTGLPLCQDSNCFDESILIPDGSGGYECDCVGTYEGELCDVSTCLNGGEPSSTVCSCFNGWTGDLCEIPGTLAPVAPTTPAPTESPTPMHQTAQPTAMPTAAPTQNNTGGAFVLDPSSGFMVTIASLLCIIITLLFVGI